MQVQTNKSPRGAVVDFEPAFLHKLNVDWGEGTSGNPCDLRNVMPLPTPGDTTWDFRFFGSDRWTNPGGTGDFEATSSGTTQVGRAGPAIWPSSAGLVADVQGWLAAPSTNFGWMMVGNEAKPEFTARRFASRHTGSPPALTVTFEETVNLTLAITADSISEGAGAGATTATVGRSGDTSAALTVNLSSSDASEATVQASVTIAAGQATSAPFQIDAVDDAIVDGPQTVTITASATASPDSTDTVIVTDDDVASLTVAIASDSISESAGAGATTATVSRNTDTTNSLVVNLTSSDTTEAAVQAAVTIAAGQTTSPAFNIDAVDDAIVDGAQTVTITAGSAGFADGTDTLEVTDDDVAATVTGTVLNGGQPNRSGLGSLMLQFSNDVTISGLTSLELWNHTTGSAVDISGATLQGNGSNAVTWTFPGLALPSGNYSAKLPSTAGVLAATHSFAFDILLGDSSGNGQVEFADFGELANGFNTSAGPYGPGDMNGDGNVDFGDFGILANNFNSVLPALAMDFGDASESSTSFPTTLVNDGARHLIGSGLFLGATVDGEADGQPDANAAGDGADEDGVTFAALQAGTNAGVTVTATVPGSAVLNAWIDFNIDGDWNDIGEQIFVDQPLSNGTNNLTAAIPPTATAGQAFARFRITGCVGHSYFGLARDGEVEDYLVTLVAAANRSSQAPLATTFNLWPAALVDKLSNAQTTSIGLQSSIGKSIWDSVQPTATGVVDSPIVQVASAEGRPQKVTHGLHALDASLVDQAFEEEPDLLQLDDGFGGAI